MMKILAPLTALCTSGCATNLLGRASNAASKVDTRGVFEKMFDSGSSYVILNMIAGLASLFAFGSIMARAFGIPLPWRTTTAAIACAVGAWTLRAILVGYLWLFVLLIVATAVFGGIAMAYSYRAWIEKRIGLDLDRDGKVGR